MMTNVNEQKNKLVRQLGFAIATFAASVMPLQVQAAPLALSDLPLFLIEDVPPNVVVTFDDSGSMLWGFLPDSIMGSGDNGYRANQSIYYNKIYYNPSVDYRPGLDYLGVSLGEADFGSATWNVYNYSVSGHFAYGENLDLNSQYRPIWNTATYLGWGWNYSDGGGPNDNSRRQTAYYYVRDDSLAGCDANSAVDDDCYTKVVVSATSGESRARPEFDYAQSTDERTNFANWYQYYSSRFTAGKTVLSRAFAPENISESVRVGRQTINRRGVKSGNTGSSFIGGASHVAAFVESEREQFYQWLFNARNRGGTPLRLALRSVGEHLKTTGSNSPYAETPGAGGDQISCRLNAHIMLTDGYWNGGGGEADVKSDNSAQTFPDSVSYSPASPDHNIYKSSEYVSLADIAFHYWATDLSTLDNNVSAYYPNGTGDATADYWNPKNDPATWQHLVNYNIAFGIAGRVPVTDTAFDALVAGIPFTNQAGNQQTGWGTVGGAGKVDDLYHAAVNSRGQFFSASRPDDLVDSLISVMNAIGDRESSAAAVDLNSSSIAAGVGVYQARFFTENWEGDLQGRPVSDGSATDSCTSQSIGSVCEPAWSVADINDFDSLFPDGKDKRIIFTSRPTKPLNKRGRRFVWGQLAAAQKAQLKVGASDAIGKDRLNYIRGRKGKEETNGGPFRTRTESRTGAFVHSSPEYVGNGFDASGDYDALYPDDMESSGITHADFICPNPSDSDSDGYIDSCGSGGIYSRTPVVYVGGNDGMLHAYDARLDHNNGGKELFNFIPNAVLENMYKLTSPTFTSGSYVDGLLESADVFYSGEWHTVLVGGLRTGGQAYFALDITHPERITEEKVALAKKLVRWEFTDKNSSGVADGTTGANGDADLGYTFGEPAIVKINYTANGSNTGRWVAIFGNGYNATDADGSVSLTGHAVLYVVDIETGLLIKKLSTKSGTVASPNGISGIAPVLNDTDFTVDYVYAGDLNGNLWKFDISSENLANWGLAYGSSAAPAPLFAAQVGTNAQPIMSTPRVGRHFQGGNLVYFGTGKYLEDSDNETFDQQSFYSIWDKDQCQVGASGEVCADLDKSVVKTHMAESISRSNLQEQHTTVDGSIDGKGARVSSDNQVAWDTQKGWYMDFPTSLGERSIGKATLRGGIVLFTTLEPNATVCESGGSSWIYALDRVDGGKPPAQVFDHHEADGEIGEGDYLNDSITSAARTDAIISDPTILHGDNGKAYILYGSSDLSAQGGGVDGGAINDTTVRNTSVRWRQLK